MGITIAKIILWKYHKTRNGYAVKIRVQNKDAKYIPLNLHSELEDWNDSQQTVLPSHPRFKKISDQIIQRKAKLIKELDYCNENNLNLEQSFSIIKNGIEENVELEIFILKQRLEKLQMSGGIGILEFYDTRIEEVRKEGKSIGAFVQCRKQFENYIEKDISLNKVTYEFLNEYSIHKLSNGCGRGGLNYYLKNLRTIYKEAQRRPDLGIKQDNPFIGVIKSAPRKPLQIPTNKDLSQLWNYEHPKYSTKESQFKTKRNIEIFKLQILIGGQDYIDVSLIEWKFLKEKRIQLHRYKNRNNNDSVLVDNELSREAIQIIEKYGDKESKRVFSFIPDPRENQKEYTEFNKRVTKSLKTAFRNMKITSGIGTKMSRFIYRNAAGQTSVKPLAILQIQGHKPEGISYNYQDRLPNKIIDRCHRQILKTIF
ncbi:MAG: phage integrase SAM-like domain-containing protein [Flavobacteriaceae bacterium]|nr:phage integrase SAM-like domain-containing protein [Flavobacteriaceae bacterium]